MGTLAKFEITHKGMDYTIRAKRWDNEGEAEVEVWRGRNLHHDDMLERGRHLAGSATWDGEDLSWLSTPEGIQDAQGFWAAVRRRLPR